MKLVISCGDHALINRLVYSETRFTIGRILHSGSAMSVELQCYLVSPHRHVFDEPGISKKLIHASMEFVI